MPTRTWHWYLLNTSMVVSDVLTPTYVPTDEAVSTEQSSQEQSQEQSKDSPYCRGSKPKAGSSSSGSSIGASPRKFLRQVVTSSHAASSSGSVTSPERSLSAASMMASTADSDVYPIRHSPSRSSSASTEPPPSASIELKKQRSLRFFSISAAPSGLKKRKSPNGSGGACRG